jgi:hypothetical protein
MDMNYTINGIMDVATFLNAGTTGLFWNILMLPVFFIIMISFRNSGNGDGIDSMNVSSFVCLMISFVLNAIGLTSIVTISIFLALMVIGVLIKRFTQ